MPQSAVFDKTLACLGLYRGEEEDLVDYDDSDIDAEDGEDRNGPTVEATEETQLDIHPELRTHPELAQEASYKDADEKKATNHNQGVGALTLSITKTPQAASLVKTLQDLLADPVFSLSLGLSFPGDNLDLHFWANGFNYTLALKITAAAKLKACRFGAKCYRARCTFDHGGADRTRTVNAGKPPRLCSMINRPAGCLNGNACWFSHEAEGVMCADGNLRETCPKGPYCIHKHQDDYLVAPAGLEYTPEIKQADELKVLAQPPPAVEGSIQIKDPEISALPANAVASSEPHATGHKRRYDAEDQEGLEDRPFKNQRVQ
ncbi:hypothetical protein EKO04_010202 [Ascochyta lentis]|uniref:C3H1-type domain-containing protein n=1 Tax=Ascochyta lentis TaxID=205686 RepID=A0A8H7IW34_9PLEO|nr:hypothetical protein EKO04_010202 [Ascochyta lentis]